MNIYQILEITPTKDKTIIRRAYASLVKKYHPEDEPQKWEAIHDAYEVAMKIAESNCSLPFGEMKKKESLKVKKEESSVAQEKTEMDDIPLDWKDLLEKAHKENQEKKKQYDLQNMQNSLKQLELFDKIRVQNFGDWKKFLEDERLQDIFCQDFFLYQWGEMLKGKVINYNLYRFMLDQLDKIEEKNKKEGAVLKQKGILDAYSFLDMKIQAAYDAGSKKGEKETQRRVLRILGMAAIIILYVLCRLAKIYLT